MIINTYKKYILNLFTKTLIEVVLIFFSLILIINLFEEINFLKNENVSSFYPVFLSLLNTPSVIFDILPFIFLVSTIFFFIKLMDKNELFIFKYSGITNSRILSILVLCAFFIGVIIIVQPGSDVFKLASLLPIASAISMAFSYISLRFVINTPPSAVTPTGVPI